VVKVKLEAGQMDQRISEAVRRIEEAVRDMTHGDRDREDLEIILTALRQLTDALEISRLACRWAHTKFEEQRITIGWLCRRLGTWENQLAAHQKEELLPIVRDIQRKSVGR